MQLQLISYNNNYFQIQQQKIYPNFSSFQNLSQTQQLGGSQESNIELEESSDKEMEYQNNIFAPNQQIFNQQKNQFYQNNNQDTVNIVHADNQKKDIFSIFSNNNNNQFKNNIFDQKSNNNNQMEVIENVNSGYQEQQQQDEETQQQKDDREMLRKCITDMMCKKQENCRSKKRFNILNEHRNRIIESTIDLIYYDTQYFTTEEFEYRVCMNIEKLIQEQEEKDQMQYYYDQELQRAEDEYYLKQLELFNQSNQQEIEEDNDDDYDSDEINIIRLNNLKFNQNSNQDQNNI